MGRHRRSRRRFTIGACIAACVAVAVVVCGCEAETDTPSAAISTQQCVVGWNAGAIIRGDSSVFMSTRKAGLMGSKAWVGGGQVMCQIAFQRSGGFVIRFLSAPVRDASEASSGLQWWIENGKMARSELRDGVGWWRACQTDAGRLELGHHCGRRDPSVRLFPYWTIHRTAP